MTKSFFLLLAFIVAVMACSTDKKIPKEVSLTPPHGGVLLKGKDYYVELVSKDEEVSIYTLQQLEGIMKVIPTKNSKVYARYSPKKSQGNWGLPLRQEDARYIGEVDPRGDDAYEIYLDLRVDGAKEKFVHTIVMDEAKK